MGMQEHSGYCDHCARAVLIRRETVNHVLHLLLTLLTCVWLVPWMFMGPGPWRCTSCGAEIPPHRTP